MDKSKIRKQFGKRVRKLRKEREMSQEDLANDASIERSYLGSIERGERSPTLDKIASIAKALKIPIRELFN
ncbi:MAG: helix-turn-helix transcriptional regulator [Candidatus Daviesbacteria bacterium]|nr:helix-turn-helix transcriptional regulator [Candidatus Daviesbacteria bacterium]